MSHNKGFNFFIKSHHEGLLRDVTVCLVSGVFKFPKKAISQIPLKFSGQLKNPAAHLLNFFQRKILPIFPKNSILKIWVLMSQFCLLPYTTANPCHGLFSMWANRCSPDHRNFLILRGCGISSKSLR